MPAPLFARFCRRIADDAKPMRKFAPEASVALLQHRSKARVYSLDAAASEEVGKLSVIPPSRLWPIYKSLRMPGTDVWIEVDVPALFRGAQSLEALDPAEFSGNRPARMGFAIIKRAEEDDRVAFGYVQYPSGKTALSPYLSYILEKPDRWTFAVGEARSKLPIFQDSPVSPFLVGIGIAYARAHKDDADALASIASLMEVAHVYAKRGTLTNHQEAKLLYEANGTCRWVACALAVVMASSYRPFLAQERPAEGPYGSGQGGRATATEISLYSPLSETGTGCLTERVLSKALRARAKKSEHEVAGHWSYRRKGMTGTRLTCPDGTPHDFERDLSHEHREACVKCGQSRWFRKEHKRGDPALGTAQKKIHNIRG